MSKDDFPQAPHLDNHFHKASEPEQDIENGPPHEPIDPLDHHSLSTWDYTPGGDLEQSVHSQLSENGRREYNERHQQSEPSNEQFYDQQMNRQFDQAGQKQEAQNEHGEKAIESEPSTPPSSGKETVAEHEATSGHSYDMPKTEKGPAETERDEQDLDFAADFEEARRNPIGWDPESRREYEALSEEKALPQYDDDPFETGKRFERETERERGDDNWEH